MRTALSLGPPPLVLPLLLASLAAGTSPGPPAAAQSVPDTARARRALEAVAWREIGPANMGGRTVGIAGVPGDPTTLYMATATGGLWRTTDQATTWESIFEAGSTLSTGAVALAPSDRNVVYLGTGENNPRNSTSVGDGVWRSTDGGDSWTHLGLEAIERVGRIRVHPEDPDRAWVAAMGHAWGPNPERGVYRTDDGGRSWERVLHVNETTGAADLALDPGNPRILYAGMYDYLRRPWHFRSGGPGSGLYRSDDGGQTWELLTGPEGRPGLPRGPLGRIGVAVAPSDPRVVYAIIESEEGVLWRSDDGGDRWRMVSDDERVGARPFYYSDIRVDPTDPHTVYAVSGALLRSVNGGRTWERLASNIHGDHQALWIDPENPDRIVDGNDGGFHVSYDGGERWELLNTVPLGQFYRIDVDTSWPYRVCGGLQDNDVWCGPGKTWTVAGGLPHDWFEIQGPGDGMGVQFDPRNPDVVYSTQQNGSLVRTDLRTGENRSIRPDPIWRGGAPIHDTLRFNWTPPVLLSEHDPDVLYIAGNRIFRTDDGGDSWTTISPDLSRGDTTKLLPSGGPITPDNSGAEVHGTVTALEESPTDPSILWAGTDDGLLHRTDDGGRSWSEIGRNLPDDLPEERWISSIELDAGVEGGAWVAVDRHRSDDHRPLLFRTDDGGGSWRRLGEDLPTPGWIHVVRQDPRDPAVVYLGTETGLWASWDRGRRWTDVRVNMPRVPVRDLVIHPRDDDLVAATHGRSIWILDDLSVLRRLPEALAAGGRAGGTEDVDRAAEPDAYLFPIRRAVRYRPWARRFRFDVGDKIHVAPNPPYGALLTYRLGPETLRALRSAAGRTGEGTDDADSLEVALAVRSASGEVIRSLRGPAREGLVRTAWDLRHDGLPGSPDSLAENAYRPNLPGPEVLPGRYTVELRLSSDTLEREVEVVLDPRRPVPGTELVAQLEALLRLREAAARGARAVRDADGAVARLRDAAERVAEQGHAPPALEDDLRGTADSLAALRSRLAGAEEPEPGAPAPLLDRLRGLAGAIGDANARPTRSQVRAVPILEETVGATVDRIRGIRDALPELERRIRDAGVRRIGRSAPGEGAGRGPQPPGGSTGAGTGA